MIYNFDRSRRGTVVDSADLVRLTQERDFYLRLLSLGGHRELGLLLNEALALIVEVTGARQGYLELYPDEDDGLSPPSWWVGHGLSPGELRGVRDVVSRGIIAEAVARARAISIPSALLDPRFRDRDSVRGGRIEAVLCVPIGDDPPRGVLYLHSPARAGPFSTADQERAELVAGHLATLA